MFSGSKKPFSAITVQIERLTSENYEEHDIVGIPDLVDVIRIQDTGPTEAARAIRKKLKYGNMHRQLRALTILDALIGNAGPRFQRTFADEPLLERLRLLPRDDMVDPDVRAKCNTLYRQWAKTYSKTPGLQSVATLYKQLPVTAGRKKLQPSQSRAVRETEEPAASPPASPVRERRKSSVSAPGPSRAPVRPPVAPGNTNSSSFFSKIKDSSKSKSGSKSKFDLEKEKGAMMEAIAASSVASTNLFNAIKLINRETQRVSDNQECKNRFDTCKKLRRQILRYIQLVESEQYIGGLLSANDELVKALMTYEVMDKSVEDDSDSDVEAVSDAERQLANLNITASKPSPPKPMKMVPPTPPPKDDVEEDEDDEDEEEEDEDNPFADSHAVKSSSGAKQKATWRDV